MRIRKTRKADAAIPTGSMADIAFLLIIFFMVTTVHEVDRTTVNVPLSLITEEAEKNAAIVVLNPTAGGEIEYKFSNGKDMSYAVGGPDDIYLEASRIMDPWRAAPENGPQFMLKADADLPFEKIDKILEQLRRADVQKVLLLTRPKDK